MQRGHLIIQNLGARLTRRQMSSEIAERIRCARRWTRRHWRLLSGPVPQRRAKFQLYKSFVRPILTYGCEVWTLDDRTKDRLQRFEFSILMEIYKSKYPHRHPKRMRPNLYKVLARYNDKCIVDYVTYDRSTWDVMLRAEQIALRQPRVRSSRVHWWDNYRATL